MKTWQQKGWCLERQSPSHPAQIPTPKSENKEKKRVLEKWNEMKWLRCGGEWWRWICWRSGKRYTLLLRPPFFYVFWGTTASGLLVLVFIRLFILSMAIYRKMYAKKLGKEKKGISKLQFANRFFFFFLIFFMSYWASRGYCWRTLRVSFAMWQFSHLCYVAICERWK